MEAIIIRKSSEEENVDVEADGYVEADLEYLEYLRDFAKVESIQESSSDDEREPTTLKRYLDGLRDSETVVHIEEEEDEDIDPRDDRDILQPALNNPEPEIADLLKCFMCAKKNMLKKDAKRCRDVGCQTYLCRTCSLSLKKIKIGSSCIFCGRVYNSGPSKKNKMCKKCGHWRCRACSPVKCRCILREKVSHHNFY